MSFDSGKYPIYINNLIHFLKTFRRFPIQNIVKSSSKSNINFLTSILPNIINNFHQTILSSFPHSPTFHQNSVWSKAFPENLICNFQAFSVLFTTFGDGTWQKINLLSNYELSLWPSEMQMQMSQPHKWPRECQENA